MKRFWWLLVLIVFFIIADQLTKGFVDQNFQLHESISVIDGFFNLTYVRNTGAAWGMGANADTWVRVVLFKIIPVFAVFFLFYLLYKSIQEKFYMSLSYALIIAGAVGNLIDRIWLDFVVDFFDFYVGSWHWPAFNIADSCITVAAIILGFDALFLQKKENKKKLKA
jgi:signal peptidase II